MSKNPPIFIRTSTSKHYHNQNTLYVGTSAYYFSSLLRAELNIHKYISRLKWLTLYNTRGKFQHSNSPVVLGLYPINTYFRAKQLFNAHNFLSKSFFYGPFINYATMLSQNQSLNANKQIMLIKDLILEWENLKNSKLNKHLYKTPQTITIKSRAKSNNYDSKKTLMSSIFLLASLALITTPIQANLNIAQSQNSQLAIPLLRKPMIDLRKKNTFKQQSHYESIIKQALSLNLIHNVSCDESPLNANCYNVIPKNSLNTFKNKTKSSSKGSKGLILRSRTTKCHNRINLNTPQLQQRYDYSVSSAALVSHGVNQPAELHMVSPLERRFSLSQTKKKTISSAAFKKTELVQMSSRFVKYNFFLRILKARLNNKHVFAFKPSRHYFQAMLRKPLIQLQNLKHAVIFELGIINTPKLMEKLGKTVKSRKALKLAKTTNYLNVKNSISIRF